MATLFSCSDMQADMEGVLCFSHILLLASPALDEVDDIARHAGGCSSYVEGWPVVALSNISPVRMCWHVRYHRFPQGLLPRFGSLLGDLSWALTKRFLVGGRPQWGSLEWPVGGGGRRAVLVGTP